MQLTLTILALLVALAAFGVSVRGTVVGARERRSRLRATDALPEDVLGLRQEVAALREEGRGALRQVALVRYDAFDEMGGHLSWSLALLDDNGDGVVMTSIHGRSEARTYAKSVTAWRSDQQLSPEETEAIESARA